MLVTKPINQHSVYTYTYMYTICSYSPNNAFYMNMFAAQNISYVADNILYMHIHLSQNAYYDLHMYEFTLYSNIDMYISVTKCINE